MDLKTIERRGGKLPRKRYFARSTGDGFYAVSSRSEVDIIRIREDHLRLNFQLATWRSYDVYWLLRYILPIVSLAILSILKGIFG